MDRESRRLNNQVLRYARESERARMLTAATGSDEWKAALRAINTLTSEIAKATR